MSEVSIKEVSDFLSDGENFVILHFKIAALENVYHKENPHSPYLGL